MQNSRVLFVDDKEDTCIMIKVLLNQLNLEVSTVMDGSEGLRRAQHQKFDLYTLDLVLLDLDGIDVKAFIWDRSCSHLTPFSAHNNCK